MKKTKILVLAMFFMVVGSFAIVQTSFADCIMTRDDFGCDVWDCEAIGCVYWHCDGVPGYGEFCDS